MNTYSLLVSFLLTMLAGLVPLLWGPKQWSVKTKLLTTGLVVVLAWGLCYTVAHEFFSDSDWVIAGVVVEEKTGRSVPEAQITIPGRAETSTTEDSGNFRLQLVRDIPESRRIRIRITKSGYQARDLSVIVPVKDVYITLAKE